jgi:hypothetical protein
MNRQKIGIILFWIGVISVIVMQALTRFQNPMQRVHTAEELSGTVYAVDGALWWIRNLGVMGLTLSIMGVLLYASEKGSYFWLLGFLPGAALGVAMLWEPSRYVPVLFGIGGTILLLSYFGILWLWTRTYAAYEGVARTGRHIQLLGYSFLVSTGLMLCMYFGNPNVLALADLPIPSAESINVTLSLSMLLLFVGQYVAAKSSKEATDSSQLQPGPQPGVTRPNTA